MSVLRHNVMRAKNSAILARHFVNQEPRLRALTVQNGELLPKGEILQRKLPTATEKTSEYSEPEQEQIVHEPGL